MQKHAIRKLILFIGGLGLAALIHWLGGYLRGIEVPAGYFEFFNGHGWDDLAVRLLHIAELTVLFAAPGLIAGAVLRVVTRARWTAVAAWTLLGVFVYDLVATLLRFANMNWQVNLSTFDWARLLNYLIIALAVAIGALLSKSKRK